MRNGNGTSNWGSSQLQEHVAAQPVGTEMALLPALPELLARVGLNFETWYQTRKPVSLMGEQVQWNTAKPFVMW